MDEEYDQAGVDLVTRVYDQCWEKSKGPGDSWIPGKLSDAEFTLYRARKRAPIRY